MAVWAENHPTMVLILLVVGSFLIAWTIDKWMSSARKERW